MTARLAVVAESEFQHREPRMHQGGARAQAAIQHTGQSLRGDGTRLCLVTAPGQHRQIWKAGLTGKARVSRRRRDLPCLSMSVVRQGEATLAKAYVGHGA
jgi:hypothetical protein